MGLTTIKNIPRIMRKNGFNNGARLMDIWFSRPAAVLPAYSASDTSTITMAWVLKFARARDVYNELISDRIWANKAAQGEIKKMLQRRGHLINSGLSFGPAAFDSMDDIDKDYINYRAIKGYYYYYYSYYDLYDDMDDMTAALGYFSLRVVVSGEVEPSGGKHKVTITDVGVYVRDSYDFEGDQHLGYWDEDDNSIATINFFSGDKVTNESFRDWRKSTKRGGDFIVFSDVKWTHLTTPDTFLV